MANRQFLTDEKWAVLSPLIPPPKRCADGRGRPVEHDDRAVMEGVLWVLRTGAAWADLPDRFPSYSTCFRRFSQWIKDGTLRHVLEALALDPQARGEIDLSECFIDDTFVVAKKRGRKVGKTKRGKGTKLMAIADAAGLPLAVHTAFASPHESPLSRLPSMRLSPWGCPSDLSAIAPRTVIRSMQSSLPTALR